MSRSTRRRAALLPAGLVSSVALLAGCQLFGGYESFGGGGGPADGEAGAGNPGASTGGGAWGGAGDPRGCVSNDACVDDNGQLPLICPVVGEECVPIEAYGCGLVGELDVLRAEGVLLIGILHRPDGISNTPAIPFAQILADDLELFGGLPIGGTERQPVAFVVCDEGDDPRIPSRHLVESLRVPVILGPSSAEMAVSIATEITIPSQALMVVPFDNTEALEEVEEGHLVWQLRSTEHSEALALSTLLAENLAASLRQQHDVAPADVLRIVVAFRNDPRGSSGAEVAVSSIPSWAAEVTAVDYEPTCDADGACIDDVGGRIRAVAPHAILAFGGREVLAIADAVAAGQDVDQPQPHWVLGEGAQDDSALADLVGRRPALAGRILTITEHVPTSGHVDAFRIRHRNLTGDYPNWALLPYLDALYAITYARIASAEVPLSGPSLATGLKRLVGPGLRTPVGVEFLAEAASDLIEGRSIDIAGLSGELDFDLTTGTAPRDWLVRCAAGPHLLVPFAVWNSAAEAFDPSSTFRCEL